MKISTAIALGISSISAPAFSAQEADAGLGTVQSVTLEEMKQVLQDIEEDRNRIPVEILDYEIAPEKRQDLSTCGSSEPDDGLEIYKTCWPVLQSYKALIRLEAAKQKARRAFENGSPKSESYLVDAVSLADAMISDMPNQIWPLQIEFGYSAYQNKFDLFRVFGRFDDALNTINTLLELQKSSPSNRALAARGYIYLDRTKMLLEAGRHAEARQLFQQALREEKSFDRIAFAENAEILMHDAIISGDEDYALSLFDDFAPRVKIDDAWFDRVPPNLRFYKMYILAGRGDVDGVIAELDALDGLTRANMPCRKVRSDELYFPLVISPLETDKRVMAALLKLGCLPEVISSISHRMQDGVDASYGVRPLPPRKN
ncbi:tetratricopeptide repeat protein [Sphingomonadaceae bacterium]|nr:tetratricopeptide repeat protein [Sphingomonadaceae bacterium]